MANLLYNGVSLPPLPQRNEEIHPCAYIMGAATINRLLLTSVPLSHDSGLTSNGAVVSLIEYHYDADTNTWVLYKEETKAISYGYRIWWSNTDIYDTTGTLYLSASDPIPVGTITDPLSFAMGWQLGCRLRAKRAVKKPVGYSYNGVVLPELPEVEGNRFAVIVDVLLMGFVSKTALFYMDKEAYFASKWLKVTGGLTYTRYDYNTETGVWDLVREDYSTTSDFSLNSNLVWGSYDIPDSEGNVVMEKTEPVPVYE